MSRTANIRVHLNKAKIRNVTRPSKKATWSALDHLATESKKQVPLDKGPLKNSCYVDVAPDGKSGTVSYDTPYAVRQHEELSYQHQRGRKAKYLEDPANDPTILAEMEKLLKTAYESQMGGTR